MEHLDEAALEAGLEEVRQAPAARGTVELVVRRPAINEREILAEGVLDPAVGLVGDTWKDRPSRRSVDGGPHPDMQLNIMSSRVTALVAQRRERWALAGDQLYIDLDISVDNLPPGTKLQIGTAVIEVTEQPHTGCAKFTERFGLPAFRWVNSEVGMQMRLRGMNARVVERGTVCPGDEVVKLPV